MAEPIWVKLSGIIEGMGENVLAKEFFGNMKCFEILCVSSTEGAGSPRARLRPFGKQNGLSAGYTCTLELAPFYYSVPLQLRPLVHRGTAVIYLILFNKMVVPR